MSKYTTGEIAKLCGVSVRTVQYYDSRNILVPSELSEGGRRLYSEQDLKRMKIICFLRDAGISINNIGELLSEDDPGSVISVLLEQQEQALREEVSERQEKLAILDGIKKELRGIDNFSVESIGDIAYAMENKKNMKKLHAILLITGIPLGIIQWTSIVLWITMGIWWPFAAYWFVAIPYAVWVSNFYFKRVVYICSQCHEVFKPNFKEAFWARHTPTLRKLTCTCCISRSHVSRSEYTSFVSGTTCLRSVYRTSGENLFCAKKSKSTETRRPSCRESAVPPPR